MNNLELIRELTHCQNETDTIIVILKAIGKLELTTDALDAYLVLKRQLVNSVSNRQRRLACENGNAIVQSY